MAAHYPKAVWAPQAILDNGTCELLASVGPITTIARLAQLIQSTWYRWEKHSGDLFELLLTLNIPPLQVPVKTTSNKRAGTASSSQPSTSSKRPRISAQSATTSFVSPAQATITSSRFSLPLPVASSQTLAFPSTPWPQPPPSLPLAPTSSEPPHVHAASARTPLMSTIAQYPTYSTYNSVSFHSPAFRKFSFATPNISSTTAYPTPAMTTRTSQFDSPF